MRHFFIGSLLFLAAIACAAEIASEDTVVSNEDFQVPNESFVEEDSPVSALVESEADIASADKAAARSGFWRRRRRTIDHAEVNHKRTLERNNKALAESRNKESRSKEVRNKQRARENSTKERSRKERFSKERTEKESRTKERATKERTNKERASKATERTNKERASKESATKATERTNKERATKETATKESAHKSRERRGKRDVVRRERKVKHDERQSKRFARMAVGAAYVALPNGPACPHGTAISTVAECAAAGRALGYLGCEECAETQVRSGSWSHAPPGCHAGNGNTPARINASWRFVYFNTRQTGTLGRDYRTFCKKKINWLPGWCNNWRETTAAGQGTIPGFGPGKEGTKEQCQAACDSDSSCHQAVFESQGPWGTGCWLGGNTMSNSQRPQHGSRNCDRHHSQISCVDECYSKAGWASTRL